MTHTTPPAVTLGTWQLDEHGEWGWSGLEPLRSETPHSYDVLARVEAMHEGVRREGDFFAHIHALHVAHAHPGRACEDGCS